MTVVTDDRGAVGRSQPQVQDCDGSMALDGLSTGGYTVAFRVTAADGCPISGTTSFTRTQCSPTTATSLVPAVPASPVSPDGL